MVFTTDLSDFLIPKVSGYTPDFGTMKESGGLTTKEVSENIMYPLLSQRGFSVTENSSTTEMARNSKFIIREPGVTLTLGKGIIGVEVEVYNVSGGTAWLSDGITQWELSVGSGTYMRWINGWVSRLQESFDIAHPVKASGHSGDIYVQYGGMEFPEEHYNRNGIRSTWQNISENYEGDFFRVAGGNSASAIVSPTADNGDSVAFPRTQQEEGIPNLTGYIQFGNSYSLPIIDLIQGNCFYNDEPTYVGYLVSGHITDVYKRKNFKFNASRASAVYKDDAEHVTPQNSAMQIWERIA